MVMLLGVGKSATINFIFDEMVFGTDTFQMVRFAL
jgi:predicted GTPase